MRTDHRTVVRFHFGRYYDPTFSSRLGASEPGVDSTSTLVEVVGPGQFVTIASYPPADNYGVDPAIEHSYVDQYVVGVEHQLRADLSVQAQYIRRNFDRFMGMTDTGSTWTAMQRPDTGPDGIAGTPDDGGMLTVYKKANPGNEFFLYTNPEGAFRRYDAVQIIGNKRTSHGWQMQAAYTWSRAVGTVTNHWHTNAARYDLGNPGTYVNPNAQINAYGHASFDFTHEVKVHGSYRVPVWGGFLVSGVYRWHTGYAWGRYARRTTFEPGTLPVRVEPSGTRRTPAINDLDLRVEKTFPLGTARQVGLFLDVFNAGNQGVPDAEAVNPVVAVSGPNFGRPQAWIDPRTWRVGVRLTF